MPANEQLAEAVEPSTLVATTTTPQTPWRERANSELQKVVQLFSSKQLPDLCAKALINSPAKTFVEVVLRQPAADAPRRNERREGLSAVERGWTFCLQREPKPSTSWARSGRGSNGRPQMSMREPRRGVRRRPRGIHACPRLPLRRHQRPEPSQSTNPRPLLPSWKSPRGSA